LTFHSSLILFVNIKDLTLLFPLPLFSEWQAEIPVELLKEVADRIKSAAEMGDVIQIKSIVEELKSESDAIAPFCDELIRLAEDFDFDGIQKIVLELDS
jgi:hypothetical protein